jgi:hypothetical protein
MRESEVLSMQNVFVKKVAAAATAGAIALTSTAAFAAPVTSANATLEQAAPAPTVDVYYRRWGPGPWIGAGIVAGVLTGAAIAAANRPYYYYDPYYSGPAYPQPGSYYYDDAPPPQPAPAPYYYNAPPQPSPGSAEPGLSAALLDRRRRERAVRLLDALLISHRHRQALHGGSTARRLFFEDGEGTASFRNR